MNNFICIYYTQNLIENQKPRWGGKEEGAVSLQRKMTFLYRVRGETQCANLSSFPRPYFKARPADCVSLSKKESRCVVVSSTLVEVQHRWPRLYRLGRPAPTPLFEGVKHEQDGVKGENGRLTLKVLFEEWVANLSKSTLHL